MNNSLPPTSFPPSPDQTANPNSSSSSLNYPFSIVFDQIYQLDFDESSYYDPYPPPNPNQPLFVDPSSYQDSSSSNLAAYFTMNEQTPALLEATAATNTAESSHISINMPPPNGFHMQIDEFDRERVHAGSKIAFRMETELEVVDDGYSWRKYGKKKVKSNPNPRNYYKCSSIGCNVKKRLERDKDDSRYVIITYEGIHNHEVPSAGHGNTTSTNQERTLQFSS